MGGVESKTRESLQLLEQEFEWMEAWSHVLSYLIQTSISILVRYLKNAIDTSIHFHFLS